MLVSRASDGQQRVQLMRITWRACRSVKATTDVCCCTAESLHRRNLRYPITVSERQDDGDQLGAVL